MSLSPGGTPVNTSAPPAATDPLHLWPGHNAGGGCRGTPDGPGRNNGNCNCRRPLCQMQQAAQPGLSAAEAPLTVSQAASLIPSKG